MAVSPGNSNHLYVVQYIAVLYRASGQGGGGVERCIVIELNQLKWLPHYTTYLTVSETHMCKISGAPEKIK